MSGAPATNGQPSAGNAGGMLRSIVRLKCGAQWHERRESSVAGACGAIFYVIVAGVVWAWLPGGHPVDPRLAGAAALAYVLSMSVTLPLRHWFAAITQPPFVLMLFVLPLNAIPMAVAVCTVAGSCLRIRSFSAARLPEWVNNNWYCVAPTAVLALGAPGPASWSHWPIYVAAFGAQFVAEVLIDVAFRLPAGWDERTSGRVAEVLVPVTVDALLTPVGLAVAVIGRDSPGAALSVLVGVLGVMVWLGHERERRLEHQQRSQRIRDTFSRFVPEAVVDDVLARVGDDLRLGGEQRVCTVMFCDLRGFTTFSESLTAANVIEVVNFYLDQMTEAIMAAGGTLVHTWAMGSWRCSERH